MGIVALLFKLLERVKDAVGFRYSLKISLKPIVLFCSVFPMHPDFIIV